VKQKTRDQLNFQKQNIVSRLKEAEGGMKPRGAGPEFGAAFAHYELSARVHAISFGGIGIVHNLVQSLKLPELIDGSLSLLKQYRPYHESDHILSITCNFMCDGQVSRSSWSTEAATGRPARAQARDAASYGAGTVQ
jgi:hypothetical protein